MKTKEIANKQFFALLEEELKERGKVRFRVKGTSMQPILRNNQDEVLLKKLDGTKLKPGDICLFTFKGTHILHRFVRKEGNTLFMQGDNVITHYEYCTIVDVLGVVEVIYRDGKEVSPRSAYWHIRTMLNRLKYRTKLFASRVYYKIKNEKSIK